MMTNLFLETGGSIIIPELKPEEDLFVTSLLMTNNEKINMKSKIGKKFITFFGDTMIAKADISQSIIEQPNTNVKFWLLYDVDYKNHNAVINEYFNTKPYVTFSGVKFDSHYIKGYNLKVVDREMYKDYQRRKI